MTDTLTTDTKTLADIINNSLYTDLELNTIDFNVETPYTAFKLIAANEQMSLDNLNKIVAALQFAHSSQIKLSTLSLVNNLEKWDSEYLWSMLITKPDTETGVTYYEWKITSTINKTLRAAMLTINNKANQLPFEVWSETEVSVDDNGNEVRSQWLHVKVELIAIANLSIAAEEASILANIFQNLKIGKHACINI